MTIHPVEFDIGGTWGDCIQWSSPNQFDKPFNQNSKFRIVGWKTPKPIPGDILKGEFKAAWFLFRFVEIEPCGDPPDMFFATVQPFERIPK